MKRGKTAMAALLLAARLTGTAAAYPAETEPEVRTRPAAAGALLMTGRWQSRYGEPLVITADTWDGVPYRIDNVTDDGWTTVVRLVLDDGKNTRLALSFPGGNRRYMMKNNLTTGRFSDAMDYTWKSRW